MIKRLLIMLVAVGLVLGGIFGFIAFKAHMTKRFLASQGQPPQAVSTLKAGYQEWVHKLAAVGTLRAVRGADLSAEVAGIVAEIQFQQGEDVPAGASLVQLRANDDIAHLRSLKAAAELARITYRRDQEQFQARAISQQTLDTDAANLEQAIANAAQQQALVDKKTIRAPFAGRLGLREVDPGQYLNAGTTVVTLQALDPIYADFFLPQESLSSIQAGQALAVKTDAYPDQVFRGEISAINPKVDAGTRNVQIRATLKNPEHRLLPGMYVTVEIAVGQPKRYLTLPLTAITFNSYGSTIYLAEEKGKDEKGKPRLFARQNFVATGDTRGDQVAVIEGVKEGDVVVTSGQLKLRNGTPIVVNNSIQPRNDAQPQPEDP